MKNKLTALALVVVALFAFSCVKENFSQEELSQNIDNETSIATPIGYKKTSLQDIFTENIESGELIEDEQGLFWFKFKEEFLSLSATDLIQYPEISSSYSLINNTGNSIDLNPPGSNVIIRETFYLDFGFSQGLNNEEIDSILLNNMNLDITVMLAIPVNAELQITFPGITYNTIPYSKDLILSSTNSFFDMMEYTIHLDNQTINKNRLAITFELTLNSSGVIIAPDQNIVDVDIRFSNIDYQAVYGYIGEHTINSPIEEILVDLNNNTLNGHFNFDHTYLNLVSENSFGVPFNFDLHNYIYRSYNAQNQLIEERSLISDQSDVVAFPDMAQIGQTVNDTTSINSGSIKLYFQDFYSTISGSLSANANPDGKNDYNFVLENSELKLSSEYAVPFWGYTNDMRMQDTIPFELRSFFETDFNTISRILFILNFTNALPINSLTQVYFCNENGTKLDSMFTEPRLIKGASDVDGNGKVGIYENEPIKVEFLEDRISKIGNTSYIVIKSDFKTIDAESAPPISWKMFSDYYFYFHIGVAVNINY